MKIRGLAWVAALYAVASVQAVACSRAGGPPALEDTIRDADEIFIARLNSAAETQLPAPSAVPASDGDELLAVEGRYTLIKALKGQPASHGTVNDLPFAPGNCSLGLMPGWDYVFFIKRDPLNPGHRWVGMFSGSFALGPYRSSGEEEPELQQLQAKINQLGRHTP